jgi:L-threonylcarbamoyladenylate synthase
VLRLGENLTVKTVLTDSPETAAEFIRSGGLAAFPTETVYGLGANVFDETAVAKIFDAKRRPADNPLIAHVARREDILLLVAQVTETAQVLIDNFFPGPLTIVGSKSAAVPAMATAGLDTIGVRMPRNEIAFRFLSACGTPVVAPSANLSGRPSPTTWHAVVEDLDGRIDCILKGDPAEIGLESTVVDCTGDIPLILRTGSISLEQIAAVLPNVRHYEPTETAAPRSPGLRHRHYSPRAKVVIDGSRIDDADKSAFIGVNTNGAQFALIEICESVDEYARELFGFFRKCDRRGIETIYCEEVPATGIGAALMDRLRRAASGK